MSSVQVPVARSKGVAIGVLFLFFSFIISVALNIAVARQVIGFLFLTFVPGLLLARVLKLDKLDAIETTFFSVGLSLSFLMIIGLLINAVGPSIGISEPLSEIPLMLVISTVILVLFFYTYFKGTIFGVPKIGTVKRRHLIILVICLVLVFLSVVGSYLVTIYPMNNIVLIIMIVAIAVLFGLSLFDRLVPSRFYPLLLMIFAITLLLHSSLISNHLNGFDVQFEYQLAKETVTSSQWYPSIESKFQPLLSISILPTIYWNILNMDETWIFKIIYPLIFAFISLVLYKLYSIWLNEKIAFLSVFLVIANNIFYTEMLALGRQMVAELFLALLLFVLFTKKVNGFNKTACFVIFGFSLVASHYAVAEIFMFLILIACFIFHFTNKINRAIAKIRIPFVVIFSLILFAWYIYVSNAAIFSELTSMIDYVYRNTVTEFFNPASRGSTVLLGIGIGAPTASALNFVGRLWGYAAELLIVIGFIYLSIKRQKIDDKEFYIILLINMALLALSIILPAFAGRLGMTRLYHIVLLSAAPLFIIGIDAISGFISKSKKKTLTLTIIMLVLIPFFLFQTGALYEIGHVESYSIPLSKYRFDWEEYSSLGIIEETDIHGINWLYAHEINGSATIYSDPITDSIVLRSGQGMFPPARTVQILSNTTQIGSKGIVYLRYFNIYYNLILNDPYKWDTSIYVNSTLGDANKIYSNSLCEIYAKP